MSSYFPRVHWSWATSGVQTQGGEKEQLWKNNFRVNTFWSVSVWETWKLIFVFFFRKEMESADTKWARALRAGGGEAAAQAHAGQRNIQIKMNIC